VTVTVVVDPLSAGSTVLATLTDDAAADAAAGSTVMTTTSSRTKPSSVAHTTTSPATSGGSKMAVYVPSPTSVTAPSDPAAECSATRPPLAVSGVLASLFNVTVIVGLVPPAVNVSDEDVTVEYRTRSVTCVDDSVMVPIVVSPNFAVIVETPGVDGAVNVAA
jgi:hypothetical protein